MKERTKHSLQVFSILTVFLLFFVLNATVASAEFYVIAGSRGVGTEIRSLPYTISSPGFYYITRNLSCPAGNHGITINAFNVTLDLMGFSLAGPGGTGSYDGIYMDARSNVEIRNGTVRDFLEHGIYENNSAYGSSHRIINIRVKDNGSSGIRLAGRNHFVERCMASGNGSYGIYIGSGSTVTGSTCYVNGAHGIYAGSGSTVSGNTCHYNTNDGISVGSGSTVIGNTCLSNVNYGIYLSGNNLVDQNSATENGNNMSSCSSCTFGTNHTTSP